MKQTVDKIDYYAVFGLKPAFFIDLAELEDKYLATQVFNHPDCGGSEVCSSLINEAYRVLSDEILRAEYITHEIMHVPQAQLSGEQMVQMMNLFECANDSEMLSYSQHQREELRKSFSNLDYHQAAHSIAIIKSLDRLLWRVKCE